MKEGDHGDDSVYKELCSAPLDSLSNPRNLPTTDTQPHSVKSNRPEIDIRSGLSFSNVTPAPIVLFLGARLRKDGVCAQAQIYATNEMERCRQDDALLERDMQAR